MGVFARKRFQADVWICVENGTWPKKKGRERNGISQADMIDTICRCVGDINGMGVTKIPVIS